MRTRSGSAAATITAPKSTPPVVTSLLTRIGASIAADMPKTASGSWRMRSAAATASAAISPASGAAAADATRS